jgi:hypothetical protein
MMKKLLFIVDPLSGSTSVQLSLLHSVLSRLRPFYEISVFTPYCSSTELRTLNSVGCRVIRPARSFFPLDRVLSVLGLRTESMLWLESWIREATFQLNSQAASDLVGRGEFDCVINMSMANSTECDIWWIQGPPLNESVSSMADSNHVAGMVRKVGLGVVGQLDDRIIRRTAQRSKRILTNSPYLRDLYRNKGMAVDGVVLTLQDFGGFVPSSPHPSRDYVLVYVGKETGRLDWQSLGAGGVRVVGFGSKAPLGTQLRELSRIMEFKGHVSHDTLVRLYSNALFTLFPFTTEPLGYVPIESMACGTPVLTYSREGPSITVENGKTGWLVDSPQEMVERAVQLWRDHETGMRTEDCVRRAHEFDVERTIVELREWIERDTPPSSAAASSFMNESGRSRSELPSALSG